MFSITLYFNIRPLKNKLQLTLQNQNDKTSQLYIMKNFTNCILYTINQKFKQTDISQL